MEAGKFVLLECMDILLDSMNWKNKVANFSRVILCNSSSFPLRARGRGTVFHGQGNNGAADLSGRYHCLQAFRAQTAVFVHCKYTI